VHLVKHRPIDGGKSPQFWQNFRSSLNPFATGAAVLFWMPTLQSSKARASGALGLIAAAFLGGGLWHALESPGQAIRNELAAAAADMTSAPPNLTPEELQRNVKRHFLGHAVTIDPVGFPARVAVTIRGLDRSVCVDAARTARRIEGLAVIELQGYSSADDCGERNDMRWQILP
jgi:hypothetical protein